jgi:hypothetical protein
MGIASSGTEFCFKNRPQDLGLPRLFSRTLVKTWSRRSECEATIDLHPGDDLTDPKFRTTNSRADVFNS